MKLRDVSKRTNEEEWDSAFNEYAIPDYVLRLIPKKYRGDITGAVWELVDGELGEVWLTEDSRPYDLRADYYDLSFWVNFAYLPIVKREMLSRHLPQDGPQNP